MTFPDRQVMYLLLAVEVGQRLDVNADGSLTVECPTDPTDPGRCEPVAVASLADALAALESRGWVEIGTGLGDEAAASPLGHGVGFGGSGDVAVTEQGRYAIGRWVGTLGGGPRPRRRAG